MNLQLLTSDL